MKYQSEERRTRFARSAIWLVLCAFVTTGFASAQSSGGGFTLRKFVIGSGVSAQGSPYRIQATAGQANAGVATGGGYSLTGGFHQPQQAGGTDRIFCNGFESTACNSTSGEPQ